MVVVQDPIFQPMERDLFLAREAYFLRNAVLTFLGGHQLLNVENYYFKALLALPEPNFHVGSLNLSSGKGIRGGIGK